MGKPSPTAVALAVVIVLSALCPGAYVDGVPEILFCLIWLCSDSALRPRETGALASIATACSLLIVARAVTHHYFVTPMVMWHAGRALLSVG